MKEVKAWRCPGGEHVMGLVVRNGSGIRQLLLFREAVEMSFSPFVTLSDEGIGDVDVIAVVEGYAADVRCSICGRVRTWVPGQEALERLLKAAGRHDSGGEKHDV